MTLGTVAHGDCIAGMRNLSPDMFRLAFADPPYNIGIDYGEHYDDKLPDETYMAWVSDWLALVHRCLTPDGSLWVLINDEYAAQYVTAAREMFRLQQWLIWYESFGVNCTTKFNRCSRHLLWFVKSKHSHVFNPLTRESERQRLGDKRANPQGKLWDSVWGIEPPIPRLVGNAKERIEGFPTQLPLALLNPIVQCASNPGDLVLDPFAGSGTTIVAAVQNHRGALGFELSERFAKLANERVSQCQS